MEDMAALVRGVAQKLSDMGLIFKCVAEPEIPDAPEIVVTGKIVVLIYFYRLSAHVYYDYVYGHKNWKTEGTFEYCEPDFCDNLCKIVEDLSLGEAE